MTVARGPLFRDAARLPPSDLPGLDPSWSDLVHVPGLDGVGRTFHVLDTHAGREDLADVRRTLFCVHGNPSWSYLWRNLVATAAANTRVVAVDQLEMGFSERTGMRRRLGRRVDDLTALSDKLRITGADASGAVVSVGHDWGGAISLGWALDHLDQLERVILLNTAVHQPEGATAPNIIRAVRSGGLLRRITVDTPAFILGATDLTRARPDPKVRQAFLAPYQGRERRAAIEHFVEDIPLEEGHPSADRLDAIADGIGPSLADTPVLMLWGPSDPVFSDLYLHDLERRLPHANVHRFVGAAHFVSEDADVVTPIWDWLAPTRRPPAPLPPSRERRSPLWSRVLNARGESEGAAERAAVIEMSPLRRITFGELGQRIGAVVLGLQSNGVSKGDRVALMIPPGIDLTVALYACWRLGAVAVLVDAGLGPRGMSRALASAAPDHLIGIPKALAAAKTFGWPGRRLSPHALPPTQAAALGVVADLESMDGIGDGAELPPGPEADDEAIVVFTSGATGPSKGVVYRHREVEAQRDALIGHYEISPDDRLVAAFAPFALYGPAMGITSVVPDMDVTAPGTLNATRLGDAVTEARATLVFASPAALASVVRTSDQLTADHHAALLHVRTLMSAGAPVRPSLLDAAKALVPSATAHTPYGMTEVLPVADIVSPPGTPTAAIDAAGGEGDGVCVGLPLSGVEVSVDPFDSMGASTGALTTAPMVAGEIVIRARHARHGYDRLWHTEFRASQPAGHHRTGDVGHLDMAGRLWVGGRTGHVITSANGPVMPVAVEQAAEDVAEVGVASAVGVGPAGRQVVVIVLEEANPRRRPGSPSLALQDQVRAAVRRRRPELDIAAVLSVPKLPVDRRHNSKIDRSRVATWAERVLAGKSPGRL